MSMTAIVDYGVGNLFSLVSSFRFLKADAVVTGDEEVLKKADRILLPGVGAFGDAMDKLKATGLIPALNQAVAEGKPLLGICLGMQLLFEKSYEYGEHEGLGWLKGEVRPLEGPLKQCGAGLKIPHMGWNSLLFTKKESPLLKRNREGDFVYFVHSYYATGCESSLNAFADYGVPVPAVVSRDNVFGCQFHPEKSGAVGLKILESFLEL